MPRIILLMSMLIHEGKEVVPESDKQRVEQKAGKQIVSFYDADFKYNYDTVGRLLKATYEWKVRGDLVIVINKTYTTQYDLNAKRFIK